MKRICIYGKGGIGKSTVVANTAAAAAAEGKRVLVVGCDPKADTTRVLMHRTIETILDAHTRLGGEPPVDAILHRGTFGVACLESGGPRAGEGCAGRGIALALQDIRDLEIVESLQPDLILFDVLGDVVCGGFSTPLRANAADTAYIVTTSDFMAVYAANNIAACIRKYAQRGGCRLGGLIFNARSAAGDEAFVSEFAGKIGSAVVGRIPMDKAITRAELKRMTVLEHAPEAPSAGCFRGLARHFLTAGEGVVPEPLDGEALEALGDRMAEAAFREEAL